MQIATVIFSVQVFAFIAMGITDHFLLQATASEVASMKPRVEVLWYEHPRVVTTDPVKKDE